MRTTLLIVLTLTLLVACGRASSQPASIRDAVTGIETRGNWTFDLPSRRGERQTFPITLDKTGLLHVDVHWTGDADSRLALILFREGTPGAYARTDGTQPRLQLFWTMPPNLVAATSGDEWQLAVVNLRDVPASGELTVRVEPLPTP